MKHTLITCVLAFVTGTVSLFAQNMNNGHTLTSLWKEYEAAQKADLPKKEAAALEKIKQEAQQKHLPADFYDAATEYVRSVQRRDWKQREALREALAREVESFGDPLVTFLWMTEWDGASFDALWAYANAQDLSGCNPSLHRGVDGFLGGSLRPFIRSDKEFTLWYLASRRYDEKDPIFQALAAQVAGLYPNEAALSFYLLGLQSWTKETWPQEQKAYQALADRYAGTAFSVYPRSSLLRIRMRQLEDDKADGKQFQALFADASALEKERKAYKGDDKTLVAGCRYPASLMEQLQEKTLAVNIKERTISVLFQNLPSADLTLKEGKKTLKTWHLANQKGSFYVTDTLQLELPVLPDGDYAVEARSGKYSAQADYTQYTLSIGTRLDGRGNCVYVTDYETGVPLRSATFRLMKDDKEVARTTLKLDGFTPLPESFCKPMSSSRAYYTLVAENGNRKSRRVSLSGTFGSSVYDDHIRCNIFRNQGAYHPGDTVRFKAIVFTGDPSRSLKVVPGKKMEMRLRDSEDNVLETLQLTTNEWGSVSGSFVLPTGLRNGRFELEAPGLGSDWFRVDEFVLPSFDLSFDAIDKLYLVGDRVPVSGQLVSYSGHSLSGVRIRVKVLRYGEAVAEEEVPIGEANRFSTSFLAEDSGYYRAEVIVTEATGETHSYSNGFYIGDELSVEVSLPDAADADLTPAGDAENWYWRHSNPYFTLTTKELRVRLQAKDDGGNAVPLPVQYTLTNAAGKQLATGKADSGKLISLALPGDGLYKLSATVSAQKADGTALKADKTFRIFCILPESRKLGADVARVFLPGPLSVASGGAVTARLGSAEGDAYTVVTLYGKDREVLMHKTLRVADGTLENISFPYKDSYPDAVRLQVFYFIHGKSVSWEREYRREKDKYTLPLQFTRFQDKAYPGTEYSFTVKTAAKVEALVAAWDKSMDAVATNDWPLVTTRDFSVESVRVNSSCGKVGSDYGNIIAYGRVLKSAARTKSVDSANYMVMDEVAMPEMTQEEIPFQLVEEKASFGDLGEVDVREDFASALTFQPHLIPSADGTLSFKFRTSDKLSTYYVCVYVHDTAMRNAVCEQEMVVSLPVKVALQEPRFLYAGDEYQAAVTVSSVADEAVSGVLVLQADGLAQEVPVTVAPGKTVTKYFTVKVPSFTEEGTTPSAANKKADATEGVSPSSGEITLTAAFKADAFSDAVRVKVPVYPAAQTLTEAHSAVLHAGEDREALLARLRSLFVNVPASEAALREITVLDMVRDAIPSHVDPSGNDVLSLSEAWYVRLMASRLSMSADAPAGTSPASIDASEGVSSSEEILGKIMACRNADGGFGWFEGMKSSPVITAVLLERFAKLRDRGFQVPDLTSSVKYLDNNQFGAVRPLWCGWISMEQYLHIRALYAQVPFEAKTTAQFRKEAKAYLVPSKKDGRGMNGRILAKARRVLTLRNLLERDGGLALAKAWGVTLGTSAKLKASVKADIASLLEYAVEHRDGGWYYPNAVMPWRGLLESEAYAHALLCDLLSGAGNNTPSGANNKADGIRLWLMLQKETQKWDAEPAFIDAITAILDGSEAVLSTRVLALSARYEAPFASIKAAGNGFTIQRKFFRDGVEIKAGDAVKVGDKIVAQYQIWNAENRSFVKVTAGREAALAPVQQLSGNVGYGMIVPLRHGYIWSFYPQGYRNVKASATEYYFDSYPEEKTTLSEEFFVERAGRFQAPALVIESLYAPHYRANSACSPVLSSVAR